MKLKDSVITGTIAGLICPFIGILIFYYSNFSENTLPEFLDLSLTNKLMSPLLGLCAVINLGVFYLFLHFDKLYCARGVIFSTIIYGITIVVLKFVV